MSEIFNHVSLVLRFLVFAAALKFVQDVLIHKGDVFKSSKTKFDYKKADEWTNDNDKNKL